MPDTDSIYSCPGPIPFLNTINILYIALAVVVIVVVVVLGTPLLASDETVPRGSVSRSVHIRFHGSFGTSQLKNAQCTYPSSSARADQSRLVANFLGHCIGDIVGVLGGKE
jgi:hypothetical protein